MHKRDIFFPRIKHHMGMRLDPPAGQEGKGVVDRDNPRAVLFMLSNGLDMIPHRRAAAYQNRNLFPARMAAKPFQIALGVLFDVSIGEISGDVHAVQLGNGGPAPDLPHLGNPTVCYFMGLWLTMENNGLGPLRRPIDSVAVGDEIVRRERVPFGDFRDPFLISAVDLAFGQQAL